MTNSFIDYLAKYEFLDAPEGEAWEYFCESNQKKQIRIIEQYAKAAFDASRDTGAWLNFEQWKNYNE